MTLIRLVQLKDTAAILAIYEPYIRETPVSFEENVPSVGEFWERIRNVLNNHPWLVCEIDDHIVGYAYATKHRERAAYRWTQEVSAYVLPEFQRKGVAKGLYTTLIRILKLQGVTNVLAGITLPNKRSVRFHENFGFNKIGVYSRIGFKMGQWHNVGWWEMQIGNTEEEPLSELKKLSEVSDTPGWDLAIRIGLAEISTV